LNEELHLKLVKIHLKSKNYTKVFHHLIEIQLKNLFTNNQNKNNNNKINEGNFYTECIGVLETNLEEMKVNRMNFDYVENEQNDFNYKIMYFIAFILIQHYIQSSLMSMNDVTAQMPKLIDYYAK
jgi:hypothetical protein